MKIYICVKDETDFNGERTYPRVFHTYDQASDWCRWEKERVVDYAQYLRDLGNAAAMNWVPNFYVVESEIAG